MRHLTIIRGGLRRASIHPTRESVLPNYRRLYYPGGMYFITANLHDRSSTLLTDHIEKLRTSFLDVKTKLPFDLSAVVIMPDHLHLIMALPPGDADFSNRMKQIKARFSRQFPKTEERSISRINRGERGIWQRRFMEHLIRDERDLESHVNYIHFNPVKHGYVKRPVDWPYSSLHRYIKQGWRQIDWGQNWVGDELNLG